MDATGGWIEGLRQPAYTGENRCLPCTVVNVVIAAVATAAVALAAATAAGAPVGLGAGVVVFALSLGAIYVRGYLVPGTPELTKRYLPHRVLRWFGKAPEQTVPVPAEDGIDPEATLLAIGALEECADGEDLCLVAEFGAAWQDAIADVDGTADRDRLLELIEVDGGDVEMQEIGEGVRALLGNRTVGTWESEAAFVADLAAAEVLVDRHPRWDDLSVQDRSTLLRGLRLFLERCPACGGESEFGTETVESCCSSHDVAAVRCRDCGARLFESGPV